jgi:hypothetical protein
MLDDLRQFFRQSWRRRARAYSAAAGVLTACMTLFGFHPTEQAANGALWLAFAGVVLAFAGRSSPKAASTPSAAAPPIGQDRHEHDLATRSLLKARPGS